MDQMIRVDDDIAKAVFKCMQLLDLVDGRWSASSTFNINQSRRLLAIHGFFGCIRRKEDYWDDTVVENVFGTIRRKRAHWKCISDAYLK